MTEAEKNEIVGLVMTEISSQAVDFDITTEQPQANDLLTAVREVAGRYVGVTLKWDDVARIATELANQAAKRAEQAETDANNILTQVQSKGTEITNFVATSKTEIETQKNESVEEVRTVYQGDLNELKGDLVTIKDGTDIMTVKNAYFPEVYKSIDTSFGEFSFKYNQDTNTYIVSRRKNASYTGILGINNIDAGIQPETGCVDLTVYPYAWLDVDTNIPEESNPRIRIYFYNSELIPNGIVQVYDYPITKGTYLVDFRQLITEKGWNVNYYDRAFIRNFTTDSYSFTDVTYASIVQRGYITENEFKNLNLKKSLETLNEKVDTFDERINANKLEIDNYYINEALLHPIRDIIHRGSGENQIAPENTIAGFKWASKNGWHFVETDVDWTSDGVAVLLHDSTINRTARNSDGSVISDDIVLNDITYQQALEYDFGIYKGSEYAGEKIPTFEQFIIACRNYNLHPYIELKARNSDEMKLKALVDTVHLYGMERNVTWISFNVNELRYIRKYDGNARLIMMASNQYLSNAFSWAESLKSKKGLVGLCLILADITEDFVSECKERGFQLGTYCPNTTEAMATVHHYVSEVISDKLKYSEYLLNS